MALPALHAAICMRRFSVCQLLQWSWGGGRWICLFLRTMRSTDTSSSPTTIDVA